MTDKREEQPEVGAGRVAGEQDATRNVPEERQTEIAQDIRPGSVVGGHEAGRTPAEERATMDEERRG